MSVPKKRSWGGWIFLLVVIAAAGGYWYWREKHPARKLVEFKTATVGIGDIIQTVTANGQLNAVTNVQVGTQVSGILKEIGVDFNSHVTNGQVIAKIDPSTYEQSITQEQADLENAKAAQEYAQLNFNRAKLLRESELISPSDYDKAIVDLHQAQAVVKMREASLKKSQVDLDRTTIYAPVDGIVISRNVDVGQTVAASFNTPTLFLIANDLRQMRIEAMVSEADVGGVDVNQTVNFNVDAFPTRAFSGTVSQVRYAPITNQNVVNYVAIVDVRNEDLKLRPGMTATASIVTGEKKGVLRIPNAALRYRPTDDLLAQSATNMTSKASGTPSSDTKMLAADTARPQGGASGGQGGMSPEERRKRWESMTPEQREQFRAMRGQGGPGGGQGRQRSSAEGPVRRTVYVLDAASPAGEQQKLKPVSVKVGISDGNNTELIEGLKEGDTVVSGVILPVTADAMMGSQQGQRSPFGGPFGGGRPRR
jgi:HlyD family secretion protein